MKLFSRTLLFFIGVVIFQSTLTIFLVTGVITRNNEADARAELEIEASAVYENYNSWVRTLWKTIIRINKDEKYKALTGNPQLFYSGDVLKDWFEEILLLSGIDSIILKKQSSGLDEYLSSGSVSFSSKDLNMMESRRDHPYIELREIDGNVYLVGTLKYVDKDILEFFIFKRIDEKFYRNLPLQERSVVFLATYSDVGTGRFLDEDIFKEIMNHRFLDIPYKEVHNLRLEEGSFNAAFQKLGKLQKSDGEEDLILILLISNEPYLSILTRINKILLSVSFVVGLFTIILSFYLSGRITQPISRLIGAMEGIRKGQSNVKVISNSGSEVGSLLQGFNEMASQLHQDKISMEKYINEITLLKDYNEKIIHSLRAGIVVLSNELTIEKVNSFFLENFRKEETDILGKYIGDISIDVIDKSVIKNIRNIISGKKSSWSEIKRTKSIVYEIKLYPLYAVRSGKNGQCVLEINDVSRKYELEGKIFQAEKLSSLSMLSAGVSHEINNPLGSIMTNVQNLLAEENNEETRTSLRWIEQETRRIAKIVRELLDFSSSELDKNEGVEINACISDVIRLINYGLEKEKRVEIINEFQTNLPTAIISSNELKQVIINLVQNSIQAIDGKGKINIKTHLNKNRKKICIRIKDTGTGVDEEAMLHIFDPFFTTKANGKGTGLGLSIVYGIIKKNSGAIDVKSKKGFGTTVTLTIPVSKNVK